MADRISEVKLTNENGLTINPATEEKQDDIISAINASGNPSYQVALDEASATVTYIGKSVAGTPNSSALWQILKIDETSNPTTFKYADGVSTFTKVWNNRATYTY